MRKAEIGVVQVPVVSGYVKDGFGYIKDGSGYIKDGSGYVKDGAGYVKDGAGYVKEGAGHVKDQARQHRMTSKHPKPSEAYSHPAEAAYARAGEVSRGGRRRGEKQATDRSRPSAGADRHPEAVFDVRVRRNPADPDYELLRADKGRGKEKHKEDILQRKKSTRNKETGVGVSGGPQFDANGVVLQRASTPPKRQPQEFKSPDRSYLPEHVQKAITDFKAFMGTGGANPQDPTPINKYLYLGRVASAINVASLRSSGVTHVLNMAPMDTAKVPQYRQLVPANFTYKEIHTVDMPTFDMTSVLDEAHEFIEQVRLSGGKVLVHCLAGINRSGFIVLGHLILRGFHLIDICQKIKMRRAAFVKNVGFQEQLIDLALSRSLLGTEKDFWSESR